MGLKIIFSNKFDEILKGDIYENKGKVQEGVETTLFNEEIIDKFRR